MASEALELVPQAQVRVGELASEPVRELAAQQVWELAVARAWESVAPQVSELAPQG